jgi:DNA-binding MarR family transcriptional regulator
MSDLPDPLFLKEQYQSADCIGNSLARGRNMLTKSMDSVLAEYDITHAQGSILWMVSTGKCSTASDLAREMGNDAASTTRMIDRLEKRKLIVRMPRGDDRRVISLRLTPGGRILAEKLPVIYAAVMNRNFEGFSIEELGQFRTLLAKLLANGFPDIEGQ